MLLAYIRVSTLEQNEQRQIELMKEKGADRLFIDKASGKNTDRKALKEIIDFARVGDVVITESISRIARNTKDLLSIVEKLQSKQVDFISVKEQIDTTTAQGKFMLTVFGALAELERAQILERQREGIEIAKRQGKYKGKPKQDIDKERFLKVCKEWRSGTITARKAMEILDLKPNTFYRRVKEWRI